MCQDEHPQIGHSQDEMCPLCEALAKVDDLNQKLLIHMQTEHPKEYEEVTAALNSLDKAQEENKELRRRIQNALNQARVQDSGIGLGEIVNLMVKLLESPPSPVKIQMKMPPSSFSFCERVTAGPTSPWHIRSLTELGLKLGGGADTDGLCGAKVSWDLSVKIEDHHLAHCCKKCVEEYWKRVK